MAKQTLAPTYRIITNAGPIFTWRAANPAEVKRRMEASIPLLDKRGYTCRWTRIGHAVNSKHVITVLNSKGRAVHSAYFFRQEVS